MNRTLALCLIGAIGVFEMACGDSSTPLGAGGTGTVQVFAKDDPNTVSPRLAAPSFDQQGSANATSYNGSLSGEMSVQIQTTAGAWVDVGSPASVTLTAHSADSAAVSGNAAVPVGTYAALRIVWHHAAAHLLAGSVIGGLTLSADVVVDIGGPDSVVIEKTVTPFTVEATANAKTEIVFDLNSEMWLTEQNVQSRTCSQASVEAAVSAATRVEGS